MLRPATKFLTNSPAKQLRHVLSELFEVIWAFIIWKITKNSHDAYMLALELVDLQMSCETLLAIIGYKEKDRVWLRDVVVRGNQQRGYYDREARE
jgi:hypothetical protein